MALAAAKPATAEPNLMREATKSLSETAQSVQQTTQEAIPAHLREPEWAGIKPVDFGLAFAILIAAVCARWLLIILLDQTTGRLARRTGSELAQKVADGTARTLGSALFLTGLFFAFSMLDLPHKPIDWAGGIWKAYNSLLIVFGAALLYRIIDVVLRIWGRLHGGRGFGPLRNELLPLTRDVTKVLLAVVALILIVQSWGYNATALLAGVGIGGLALAFAAQDTVANVFGSLMIYADRPFKTGDWVEVDGVSGIVEEIGIRSTRIRTFEKCLVSIPNKAVTAGKLYNWGAMTHRRIRWRIGIAYGTPAGKLEELLASLRVLVAEHAHVVPEMWLVQLEAPGSYSLEVLVQAYLALTEYQPFLECQEGLLLRIIRLFDEMQVEFALPSQALYHHPPQSWPALDDTARSRGA